MPHTILGLPTVNARTGGGADVGRDRWTLSLHFTFFETVDPELMIVNPMGILITYVRGDRALLRACVSASRPHPARRVRTD